MQKNEDMLHVTREFLAGKLDYHGLQFSGRYIPRLPVRLDENEVRATVAATVLWSRRDFFLTEEGYLLANIKSVMEQLFGAPEHANAIVRASQKLGLHFRHEGQVILSPPDYMRAQLLENPQPPAVAAFVANNATSLEDLLLVGNRVRLPREGFSAHLHTMEAERIVQLIRAAAPEVEESVRQLLALTSPRPLHRAQ